MINNNISSALSAYQHALSRVGAKPAVEAMPATDSNASFKNLVKDVVSNAVDLSQKAESASLQNISGKADIQDVVLAVSNAELALETVVAVRDTAVKAYKEIMSMPI